MAILETCCFWKNVKKGSFACGIYTLVYFSFVALILLYNLLPEKEFLFGDSQQPVSESILEEGQVTVVTVIFHILLCICSVLMVFSSILLIAGLRSNKRQYLIPWIVLMLCNLFIEFGHLIHLLLAKRVSFNPVVGFIFTIDFFIFCLNLYCLLCVISQYQLYRVQSLHDRSAPSLVVVFDAPQKLNNATTLTAKVKSRRLLSASPLVTSQRPTNFSTITEEDEQSRIKLQRRSEQYEYESIVKNSHSHNESAEKINVEIPIIMLDPNSVE